MRSDWTGAISLSLINLPVKLGSTSKNNSLGLHMVRKSDGSRIRFTRVAEADSKEVPWSDIGKGYTAPDGSLVVLDRKDFEQAYGKKNRTAEILMFTEPSNIPPMASKTTHWVQPDTGGEKTYALLAHALQESGKVAVLTFAMRDRESVAVLRAHDGYLSLESLEWDADIIRPDFAAPPQTATEAEQSLACDLIASYSGKYDHAASTDKSTAAVMDVIQAKIETGQAISPPAATSQGHAPVDLTEALKASVAAQKGKNTPATARKPRASRKAAA